METYHYDDQTDVLTIQRVEDVAPILKSNRQAFNDFDGYKSEVFNKKATIPDVVYIEWCKVNGIKVSEFLADPTIVKRFLNDPDNSAFLLIPGKI